MPGGAYGIWVNGSSAATVSDIRVTGGYVAVYGGAASEITLQRVELVDGWTGINLPADGLLEMTDSVISGQDGAGMWTGTSEININGGSITDNYSGNNGAVTLFGGTLSVDGTAFSGNLSGGNGSAIYVSSGSASIEGSTFTSNSGAIGGAAFFSFPSAVSIESTRFESNSASSTGGAIYITSATDIVSFTDVTFSGNMATSYAGALATDYTDVTLSGGAFEANTAGYQGGAWYMNGDSSIAASVSGTTFSDNWSVNSGAVALTGGSWTQSGGTFSRNTSTSWGGLVTFGCATDVTLSAVALGTGADANSPDGVYDASGDLFGGASLDLSCTNGECDGGASNACDGGISHAAI